MFVDVEVVVDVTFCGGRRLRLTPPRENDAKQGLKGGSFWSRTASRRDEDDSAIYSDLVNGSRIAFLPDFRQKRLLIQIASACEAELKLAPPPFVLS
jgi:hypothetical protein